MLSSSPKSHPSRATSGLNSSSSPPSPEYCRSRCIISKSSFVIVPSILVFTQYSRVSSSYSQVLGAYRDTHGHIVMAWGGHSCIEAQHGLQTGHYCALHSSTAQCLRPPSITQFWKVRRFQEVTRNHTGPARSHNFLAFRYCNPKRFRLVEED